MPGWTWMLFGLSLGLAVAVAIYVQLGRSEPSPPPMAATLEVPEDTPVLAATSPPANSPAPTAQPPQSQFTFYELLRDLEVPVPQPATNQAQTAGMAPPAAQPQLQPVAAGNYIVQTGSFNRFEDADRMRATLAMQGIVSFIQEVEIGQQIYHRVRIGPINDPSELERLRTQLSSIQIDSLAIRMD